jgi:hypothetical protein
MLHEFPAWGVDALVAISWLRGDKDKTRNELKDALNKCVGPCGPQW